MQRVTTLSSRSEFSPQANSSTWCLRLRRPSGCSLPDRSIQRKPTTYFDECMRGRCVQQHDGGNNRRFCRYRRCQTGLFSERQARDRRRAWASSSARGSGCAMALSWSYSLCSSSVDEGGITIWIVRKRSPWLPFAAGRPLPFSRSLLSARLPGGTFIRTGSINVGAMTSAPKAASHGKTGRET
jgi:hypothetical protein